MRPLVILNKPSDWKQWFMIFKEKAKRQDIWSLCDPDLSAELILPIKPVFPLASEIKDGATSLTELDPAQLNKF